MSRVIAVVEGQTEQGFVREVLAPFLSHKNVYMTAQLVGKPGHKGGDCRYERAKRDVLALLRQEADTVVTTMFDFYALPDSWPGRAEARTAPLCRKGRTLWKRPSRTIFAARLARPSTRAASVPTSRCTSSRRCSSRSPRTICAVLRSPESEKEVQVHSRFLPKSRRNQRQLRNRSLKTPSECVRGLSKTASRTALRHNGLESTRCENECPHFARWVECWNHWGCVEHNDKEERP